MIIRVYQFDFDNLLTYSLRYTFGRMTYAGSHVIDIIKRHINEINSTTIKTLIRDIEVALEDHKRGIKIGMDVDKDTYEEFLDYLKLKLNKREKKRNAKAKK